MWSPSYVSRHLASPLSTTPLRHPASLLSGVEVSGAVRPPPQIAGAGGRSRCLPQGQGSLWQVPSWNPGVGALAIQTCFVPCLLPISFAPALSLPLPLASVAKGGRIGLVPLVLTYLDNRNCLKWVKFPYLFTKIYINHKVTEIGPFAVIPNIVLQNNWSEIDFGGLIRGPNHLL